MAATTLPRGITRFRGRYRVRLDVDGETHSLGVFDTLGDARAALDIAKGERARGTFVPPAQVRAERRAAEMQAEVDALTLSEWAEQWLEGLAANPERSPSTVGRGDSDDAALTTVVTEREASASLAILVPAYEDAYATALDPNAVARMGEAIHGTFLPDQARRILADESWPHLAGLLYRHQRTGTDVRALLAQHVESLAGARSPCDPAGMAARRTRHGR